jgi:hypothetical protein
MVRNSKRFDDYIGVYPGLNIGLENFHDVFQLGELKPACIK